MTGAFAYLILTSARNRIRSRLARLRNPRYALALLLGAGYLWAVYLRPRHGETPAPDLLGGPVVALLPLALFAYVAWTWVFGSDRNALAFSQAEVTLLFTAPVSRRALVLYKVVRAQLAIVVTSLVWTLILRRSPTWGSALTHLASYWVLLSTINLNRLGVAMIRASGEDHGLRAARRHWLPVLVVVAAMVMVAVPLVRAWPAIAAGPGVSARADVVVAALAAPTASVALLPFRVLLAPLALTPGAAWLAAFGPALLLLALMLLWVLRTDAAFEEAAAEASVRQAQRIEAMRSRRAGTSSVKPKLTRTIPLAPAGPPAVALLWKNAMWVLRTGQLRGLLTPAAAGLLCIAVFGSRSELASVFIALGCGILAFAMLLVGPMTMRNDLRSELLHLSLLKTFPLRGRDVVLAEVASSALPLTLMQYLLGLVALLSLAFVGATGLTGPIRVAIVVGAPLLLFGLNVAVSLIHNAFALLFPGWARLGPNSGGGVESLGFGMIAMAIALVMFAVLLVVPAAAAAVIVLLLRAHPPLAIVAGALAAAALLLGEGMLGAWALGGSLDRVEPMQEE